MDPINLDSNATYGLLPEVLTILRRELTGFSNPSSIHRGGQYARAIIEEARDLIKLAIGAGAKSQITFTSGATEANNTAIFSPFWSYLNTNRNSSFIPELIISAVEHPATVEAAAKLHSLGVVVHTVYPRGDHRFYAEDFVTLVNERTKLISVMMVNNETGILLPVEEICRGAKFINPKLQIHTDAVQAFGKVELAFEKLNIDFMSISAHKIGGLAGTGALISAEGVGIEPLLIGGPQEVGRRAGTENVLGIYSFGLAARLLSEEGSRRFEKIRRNAKLLQSLIQTEIPQLNFNFTYDLTVGNTLSVQFPRTTSSDLVAALDLAGLYVSSGSACSSGKANPSPVLLAHGFSAEKAIRTVRLSVGHLITKEQITEAVIRLKAVVERLQAEPVSINRNEGDREHG